MPTLVLDQPHTRYGEKLLPCARLEVGDDELAWFIENGIGHAVLVVQSEAPVKSGKSKTAAVDAASTEETV